MRTEANTIDLTVNGKKQQLEWGCFSEGGQAMIFCTDIRSWTAALLAVSDPSSFASETSNEGLRAHVRVRTTSHSGGSAGRHLPRRRRYCDQSIDSGVTVSVTPLNCHPSSSRRRVLQRHGGLPALSRRHTFARTRAWTLAWSNQTDAATRFLAFGNMRPVRSTRSAVSSLRCTNASPRVAIVHPRRFSSHTKQVSLKTLFR